MTPKAHALWHLNMPLRVGVYVVCVCICVCMWCVCLGGKCLRMSQHEGTHTSDLLLLVFL